MTSPSAAALSTFDEAFGAGGAFGPYDAHADGRPAERPAPVATTTATASGTREQVNLDAALRYLALLEAGEVGAPLAACFTPDTQQREYPNRLVPAGARRDLTALLQGAARGQQVLQRQRFDVQAAHAVGDTVVLEVLWTGTLALPIGMLPAGGDMRAHVAVVLEFLDGRIHRQRNYDCFEAF